MDPIVRHRDVRISRRRVLAGAAATAALAAAPASAPASAARMLRFGGPTNGGGVDWWLGAATGAAPPVSADSAFVANLTTQTILFTKTPDTICPGNRAASTTKMMTAIVLAKYLGGSLSNTTTCLAAEVDGIFDSPTNAALLAGDIVSLQDLLYGLLLPSGNDAGEVIARYCGEYLQRNVDSPPTTVTATSGRVRFLLEMNAQAALFGMTNTVYQSPHGINWNPASGAGGTDSNTTTARDHAHLTYHCFLDPTVQAYTTPTLQTIGSTQSRLITITGVNARTYTVKAALPLVGPDYGAVDTGLVAGKGGSATDGIHYSTGAIWQAPNGDKIVVFALGGGPQHGDRDLDSRGLYWEALSQFPSLAGTDTDASFSSVVFLSGGESGFTDESTGAHALTATGATRDTTTPIVGSTSYLFNGVTDHIDAADASDLSMGSGDFTIEFWWRGSGAVPGAFAAWVSKYDSGTNQREYTIQWDTAGQINAFVSLLGSDPNLSAYLGTNNIFGTVTDSFTPSVLFNGALRHMALVRSGSSFSIYVNGLKGSSVFSSASALFNGTANLVLGARQSGAGIQFPVAGRIDEVRITKGVARYSGTKFSPIPRPFARS